MSKSFFTGIQQVGIGVPDAAAAFNWYNKFLGLNVPVFDDVARAELMLPHTNGIVRERRAILAVNMAGGGGAEIWESKDPKPLAPKAQPSIGDLGIFSLKVKSPDVAYLAKTLKLTVYKDPADKPTAYIKDPYGNQIQLVEDESWFKKNKENTGGVVGVTIGVSDMDKSIKFYKNLLGIDELIFDKTGVFEDLVKIKGGERNLRRVLLKKSETPAGAFYKLFGNIQIELVQLTDATPQTIMEGRSWGDLGFIHVCFDTLDMASFKEKATKAGHPFTVDSGETFDMGDAGGRFSYIPDPDGTLLEFVETHKVPVMQKLGIFINLKKRGMLKPLPNWMINTLGWGKVKPDTVS